MANGQMNRPEWCKEIPDDPVKYVCNICKTTHCDRMYYQLGICKHCERIIKAFVPSAADKSVSQISEQDLKKIKIRNICALFFGILSVPVVTTYIIFAIPFPAIEEFVSSGSQNKIQQVPNSKWCVPTCIDIASAYIVRALKLPADISVKHNILVNGAVHENITDNGLDLEGQFETIEVGAAFSCIPNAPMGRIKKLICPDCTHILSAEEYILSANPHEFLKNALYRKPTSQRRSWQYNKSVGAYVGARLNKQDVFAELFTDKNNEQEVNDALGQLALSENDKRLLYSLNSSLYNSLDKAIPCLHWNLPFAKEFIEGKLNKWFPSECDIKPVLRQADDVPNSETSNEMAREMCFNDIVANVGQAKLIILDCVYDRDEGGGNHACIVVGKGNDFNGQFLEVYNPDPSYRGINPMKMHKQLTYTAPDEKTKVVSRYAIITPVILEEASEEENES